MRPLYDLTLLGRGRRLRPVAEAVLTDYGIRDASLRQLTEASNIIFRVSTEREGTYVLRMTAPKSCHGADEIRSEVAWLHALARDTDLGIPEPIARLDGDYVTLAPAPGAADPVCCALYRWVPGRMLDHRLTEENVRRLGSLMARLHEHAAGFTPPEGFRIRRYDSVFPYSDASFPHVEPIVLFNDGADSPLSEPQRRVFQRVFNLVADDVRSLSAETSEIRVIHNDLHVWNVKVDGDRLYALDFEDMMWGHPMQDVATTLYYFRWRDTYEAFRNAFQRGYTAVLPWPERHDGQLETLIMGRMLLLANYVATSEDSEDLAMAPEYLARVEARLSLFLEVHG
jgi:Ser/Thr protein kinase RdoA (MazF antagonist)